MLRFGGTVHEDAVVQLSHPARMAASRDALRVIYIYIYIERERERAREREI